MVGLVGVATVAFKAAGPVVLGPRRLPERVAGVVGLLAPALFAALVVTQTFGEERGLTVDARAVGVGAAAIAVLLRAPMLVVIVVAAGATAVVRAV